MKIEREVFEAVDFIKRLAFYRKMMSILPEEPEKKVEVKSEEQKKQEELRKNFENLMGYGYEEALKKE